MQGVTPGRSFLSVTTGDWGKHGSVPDRAKNGECDPSEGDKLLRACGEP